MCFHITYHILHCRLSGQTHSTLLRLNVRRLLLVAQATPFPADGNRLSRAGAIVELRQRARSDIRARRAVRMSGVTRDSGPSGGSCEGGKHQYSCAGSSIGTHTESTDKNEFEGVSKNE